MEEKKKEYKTHVCVCVCPRTVLDVCDDSARLRVSKAGGELPWCLLWTQRQFETHGKGEGGSEKAGWC